MRIVLKGAEAEHYFRLLAQDARLSAIESSIDELTQTVTHSTNRTEELVSQASDRISQKLDQLENDVAAARDQVINTVQGESEEDREQNARLAEKQAALDEANAEIQRLRDQLDQGVSPEEEAVIEARLVTLSQKVAEIKATSQVTDPNAPQP